jgi:hypothetical protein
MTGTGWRTSGVFRAVMREPRTSGVFERTTPEVFTRSTLVVKQTRILFGTEECTQILIRNCVHIPYSTYYTNTRPAYPNAPFPD